LCADAYLQLADEDLQPADERLQPADERLQPADERLWRKIKSVKTENVRYLIVFAVLYWICSYD